MHEPLSSLSFVLLPSCIKLCSPSWCILLPSAQCGLIPFLHIIYTPPVSHVPVCQFLGPTRPQGESKMCHENGDSPRSQPPSSIFPPFPCPYIITLPIHTSSLVLFISFPINTQFWLHFPEQTGRASGLWHCWYQPLLFNNYHWILEGTILFGLTLFLCLHVRPLSTQASLSPAWEMAGHSKVTAPLSMLDRRDSTEKKVAKQTQPLLDTRDILLTLINHHQEINNNKPQGRRGI